MLLAAGIGPYRIAPGDVLRPSSATCRRDRTPARSTPCCSRSACRASWPPRWSARRWRRPARPTRACSAIRWCRRTSSASRPARASARCSASCWGCRSPPSSCWASAAASRRSLSSSWPGARRCAASGEILVLVLAGIVVGALAGRGDLAGQGAGRSLRPTARHHLLAARQPCRRQGRATCRRRAGGRSWASCRSLLLRWRIGVLSLGDDEARALGVDVGRLRGHRDRRRDADHRQRRRDLRRHRLGRAGGAAYGAAAGRPALRPAAARRRCCWARPSWWRSIRSRARPRASRSRSAC